MLHDLTHRHSCLTRTGIGQVLMCQGRLFGRLRAGFQAEGTDRVYVIDPAGVPELVASATVLAAMRVVARYEVLG